MVIVTPTIAIGIVNFPRIPLLLVLGGVWALTGGCQWMDKPTQPLGLSIPAALPDAVVALEVRTLRLPSGEAGPPLWAEVDETAVDVETRRQWRGNGLRIGVVGRLPTVLETLLTAQSPDAAQRGGDPSAPATLDSGQVIVDDRALASAKQLMLRPGRRGEIAVGPTRAEMVLLRQGPEGLRGDRLQQAQGRFVLAVREGDSGRVRLELTPTVFHGQPRQRVQGEGGILRVETQQEQVVFEELRTEVSLAEGETLLIGGCGSVCGLGGQFFSDSQESPRRLLLVRLLPSGRDALSR